MGNCCYFCTRKPEIDRELRVISEAYLSIAQASLALRAVCAIFDMLIQLHLPDGGRVIFLCLVITRLCAYIY